MTGEPIIKFTFAVDDRELDDERRQKIANKLLREIRDLDEVEKADRGSDLNPEAGSKGFATLIGVLTAEVSMKNVKSFLGFLSDRLADKPIKINIKVGDKEVNIEAKSRKELLESERIAKDLLAATGGGANRHLQKRRRDVPLERLYKGFRQLIINLWRCLMPKKIALLIGVSKYGEGIPPLSSALNDVEAYAPKNPEAEYRKLVEQYAQNGELSKLSYLILKPKRKTFGITDEKAEQIESEVLEPLRRRFANLESYKQAFIEVVEQKYPLDEHTRKILKDLSQDILGLRNEDIAPIELEITSAKKAEYRKQVQIQKEQEKEEYENSLRYYEQEFTKAVKVQYPLDEYVRNGLKQFQESLGLNDEDVERIEAPLLIRKQAEYQKQQQQEVKKQRQEQQSIQITTVKPTQQNNELSSEKDVNYTRLRDLLKAYEWEEADKETLAVMLKIADREQKVWLDPESIKNFPSTDLRTIDQLWVKYSDGRFGFSVQKRIWESVGKDYTKLGDRVSWRTYETLIQKNIVECLEDINKKLGFKEEAVTRTGAKWLYYTDLTFDIHAPKGHLPATLARGEGEHNDFGGGWVCVPALLSRRDL